MTSNNTSNSDYLLVKNIQKIDDLGDYASKQIITFDYSSHVFLNEKKISHIISDTFSSIKELKNMDNLIYSLVNWYDTPSIKNTIFENNINLGELFFLEFRDHLVSFLKSFIEISNLIKLNPSSHYFVFEEIGEIVSTFTQNITKVETKHENISVHESINNSIDVPLKLGSKTLTLKLSKKNASKIQLFLNKITHYIFSNKKINQRFLNVLLVNFSTIKNKEFLLEIPNFRLNVIKYDRSTPAIWNKHSLNIIKNSNCIIENEFTLLDKKSLLKIKQNEELFLSKIDSIFSSDILKTHFSLNQESFWNAIKPLLLKLCKKQFLQAAKEIELAQKLLKKYSFSKILFFNESLMVEQIIIKLAKQQKIPVYVLQHGLYYDSKEFTSEEYFQRAIPTNIDYFIGWGNVMRNYLLNNKIESNKIKIIGSIFFDKLFQNKITPCEFSGHILFASDPLAFNRIIDLSDMQKKLYRNTVEEVCKVISIHNKKLSIKTHPQKNEYEKNIAKKIDPTIKVYSSGDIHPLIKSSDLVITTDITTVILEAMILQKPVISIRMKDHYGKPDIFNYCPQITLNSLDSWIKSFYADPDIRKNLIAKGNEYVDYYISNQGKSSKALLELLQEN